LTVLTNPKYNDKVKQAYFKSKAYHTLWKSENKVLDHALIGRKLYETENQIVLSFTVLTTQLNEIYYDKLNQNPVNVLNIDDYQGLVKACIIIYIDKDIIDNNIVDENGQKIYNIKWSDILNKLKNDPEVVKNVGGKDKVDQIKTVYMDYSKNEGFHISFHGDRHGDRANLSFENFAINYIKVNGENLLKLKNNEE